MDCDCQGNLSADSPELILSHSEKPFLQTQVPMEAPPRLMNHKELKGLIQEYIALKNEGAGNDKNSEQLDQSKIQRFEELTKILNEQKKIKVDRDERKNPKRCDDNHDK